MITMERPKTCIHSLMRKMGFESLDKMEVFYLHFIIFFLNYIFPKFSLTMRYLYPSFLSLYFEYNISEFLDTFGTFIVIMKTFGSTIVLIKHRAYGSKPKFFNVNLKRPTVKATIAARFANEPF